jgi:LmbE family N-acetylglucosaminyl deacetylase
MGENKNMKILIVAPHPDDEVIGCGGTITRHVVEGDKVFLLVMTQIYSPEWNIGEMVTRKNEVFAASKTLGIKKVFFAGLPTAKLNTVPTITLVNKIREIVEKIKPEIIYLPPQKDLNTDHTLVFNACLIALKSNNSLKKVFSYEVPTIFRFKNIDVTYYVDISKFFKKKILAIKKYKSELKKYPHPRSLKGLSILAQERGLAIAVKYAEAFSIIREIAK